MLTLALMLTGPRISILDEATSSVDTQTELIIQEALARLLQGRTWFVIAHRLSTIVHADRIVVLDDGCIVGRGSHAETLAPAPLSQVVFSVVSRYLDELILTIPQA